MTITSMLIGAFWALCTVGLTWHALRLAQEVSYVTLADGRKQVRRLPLLFRLMLPLAPSFDRPLRRPALDPFIERTTRKLVSAGFEDVLTAREFLALRLLVPMVTGIAAVALLHLLFGLPQIRGTGLARQETMFALMAVLLLVMYPGLWLKRAIAIRYRSMQRSLPFVLDLLTLSVEAGLDFMSAIQRIVERREVDPLGEEFIRVLREIQLGKTRREALRGLAIRVDEPDVRTVMNALVQADELGVGIGQILRIQADQVRNKRFERAEKLANEAPVKLLFPLLAFIFPSVFLVLLGPLILDMLAKIR